MSKNGDFISTLKSIANNLHLGNKSATDLADSLNTWIKESGEALKVKIEDEVERSVSKMGFVKRGEFEALKQEVATLKKAVAKKSETKKSSPKKSIAKKSSHRVVKKAATKKVAK